VECFVTRTPVGWRSHAFRIFKYATYVVLTVNAIVFSAAEIAAARHVFRNGLSLTQIIEAFPVTVDAFAWLTLLWLFELETYLIPEKKIRGLLKWGLHAARAICYALAFYAFYGFLANLELVYDFVPFDIEDVCSLSGAGFSFMVDFPAYVSLDLTNCKEMTDWAPFFQLPGHEIITDHETLAYAKRMAWVELVNDAAWLLLVLVLEADVLLLERQLLRGPIEWISNTMKRILYVLLFAAAIAWGVESGLQDFVDAALWLAAFVFIDLNRFETGARGAPKRAAL
jgi:hypothetical protein